MQIPSWFPDEVARAGQEHLDPAYVRGYDNKAGVDPTEDVELLRQLGLDETSTLIDLGAGTGTFALAVAPLCRRVIAVDVSAAMLARLRENAEDAGIRNVECVQGGFLSYEHQGAPAAVVYSRNALHHLPDFWKAIALRRIAAMMKPGGVLRLRDLVYSFDPDEADAVIDGWLDRAPASPERGWTRPELEKDIREEYITFNWLLEPILERAGFELRDASHHSSRLFSAYTCVRTS